MFFQKSNFPKTESSQVKPKNPKTAFTLIELAISILIISILMSGVFSIATGSIVNSKAIATTQKLDRIYKALGSFLSLNKRLPCPASLLEFKNESVNYGNEVGNGNGCSASGVYQSTTNGNLYYGAIPTRALNLSADFANDEYGNKFSYIVDQRFTYNFIPPPIPNMASPSFGTASATGVMTISERQANNSLLTLTTDAIVVILSHGPNLRGGFIANSAIQNTLATEVDEASNQPSIVNNLSAIFDNIFVANSLISDVYDDIMIYKTRLNFLTDFSMSNLIPCDASGITDPSFVPKSLYNGQYLYAQSACALNNQYIKILQCTYNGFNGQWQSISTCP